jgi:hypothetical protein
VGGFGAAAPPGPPPVPVPSSGGGSSNTAMIIGIAAGAAVALILIGAFPALLGCENDRKPLLDQRARPERCSLPRNGDGCAGVGGRRVGCGARVVA